MLHFLAEFIREGGPFMIVNCVFLSLALASIIERSIMILFRFNINAHAFMAQIQKLVLSNNVDRAIKLCNAAPRAALTRVIKAGLTRSNKGPREVSRSLEEAIMEVSPQVAKRVATLWSLANIATLVGLVGTIVGLIGTFKALGPLPPEQKQIALSKGISEAMNNTAFGLIIAVTCIIAHMVLNTKAKSIVEDVEFHALRLENMLTQRSAGEAAPVGEAKSA